jgi:GTP-binding protein Era
MTSPSTEHRCGFVAVMGRPNVGKSTLLNALVGMKIAAVSPWPQTTRRRQLGILTRQDAQVIFVDTPGVHKPLHKLGEWMNEEATDVLENCDVTLFLVDVSLPPNPEDILLADLLKGLKKPKPTIMALNKMDLVEQTILIERESAYQRLYPAAVLVLPISATRGDNLGELLDRIISLLPEAPAFYPEDQLTDLFEREIAADLIREAALYHLRDEVPHSIAVRIDEFKERNEHGAFIAATLFVERESQKGIVIGQNGLMLKKIGMQARREIEAMTHRKVFLQLRVKVRKNWRNDEKSLRQFGFSPFRK